MLLALIVPEAIIAWALKQRLAATKGFFAIMGGFMEYEGNRPIRVLYPSQLGSYSLTGNGDFPRISKAEIQDRSKSDAISKAFVVLQTGWFITQCIARGVQGLPITELELATVAFAALNFVMYLLWWEKPLNVQRGVRVYKKRAAEEVMDDGDVEATIGFWVALRDAIFDLPATIRRGPFIYDDEVDEYAWIYRVLFWPIARPLLIIGNQNREYERYEHLRRVDTFSPVRWDRLPLRGTVLVSAIASGFGAIHCIGWSFTFPSSTEQTLWRVASVSISGIPILFLPLLFALSITPDENIKLKIGFIIMYSQSSLYVLCRLGLLVLPILCLRSLPPAVYRVVHWTSLIPHV